MKTNSLSAIALLRKPASKHRGFTITVIMAVISLGGLALSQDEPTRGKAATDHKTVDQIISSWKSKPQEVARKMIAKYGQPHEATEMRLIWHNNGPWKHTILVNEEIPHNFPKPHTDMLFQAVNYRVPADKFDELAEYDGSVIVERTKGEIAARCDMEEANFLALNLANDIVTGKKSVGDARKFYAEAMREMKHPEYKQGFLFQVPKTEQGDPDQEVFTNR